jgi:hypothetical protein
MNGLQAFEAFLNFCSTNSSQNGPFYTIVLLIFFLPYTFAEKYETPPTLSSDVHGQSLTPPNPPGPVLTFFLYRMYLSILSIKTIYQNH